MFNSNKISLGSINICLKQINFSSNQKNNALICRERYNLFNLRQKFIWFKQIFIWFKDTLFESNKFYLIRINHFFTPKKVFQTNNFLWFNQIFFLSVFWLIYNLLRHLSFLISIFLFVSILYLIIPILPYPFLSKRSTTLVMTAFLIGFIFFLY